MAKKPICIHYSCNYCGLKYTVHAINHIASPYPTPVLWVLGQLTPRLWRAA